tara:strand:- start:279 stop:602 length:324 start_codon:yes stop_codon:yes gene_type:complete
MSEIQTELALKYGIGGHCHTCCIFLGVDEECEDQDEGICKTHALYEEIITMEIHGMLPSVSPEDTLSGNQFCYGYTPVYPDGDTEIPKAFFNKDQLALFMREKGITK